MNLWELTNAPLTVQAPAACAPKITLGEGRQMHGNKELCIFLSKAEINLSSMGRRIETAENFLILHCNGLVFLSHRSHWLFSKKSAYGHYLFKYMWNGLWPVLQWLFAWLKDSSSTLPNATLPLGTVQEGSAITAPQVQMGEVTFPVVCLCLRGWTVNGGGRRRNWRASCLGAGTVAAEAEQWQNC